MPNPSAKIEYFTRAYRGSGIKQSMSKIIAHGRKMFDFDETVVSEIKAGNFDSPKIRSNVSSMKTELGLLESELKAVRGRLYPKTPMAVKMTVSKGTLAELYLNNLQKHLIKLSTMVGSVRISMKKVEGIISNCNSSRTCETDLAREMAMLGALLDVAASENVAKVRKGINRVLK